MVDKAKKKFDLSNYALTITGKHLQITEAIENYVKEKITKIGKFAGHLIEIDITLEVQKLRHTINIVMKFLNHTINVHATSGDIYSAIDLASEKLSALVRKYKNRLIDHRAQHLSTIDLRVNVLGSSKSETEEINELIVEESVRQEKENFTVHNIVSRESMPLHLWTQGEAVMKLEISDKHFLIYKSQEDQKLKVIYKRDDDQIGVIEVES